MKIKAKGFVVGALAGAAMNVAIVLSSCAWPQANADVVELKALFKEYRARVVPANPTQTATLDKLADHIESSFDSMDRLTK